MTDIIQKALVRLRSHKNHGGDKWYVRDMPGSYGVDLETLAKAYMAEHPADDDEPVTEKWLSALMVPTRTICFDSKRCGEFYVHQHGSHLVLMNITTRGQVRLLCRALGIELKEEQ